MKCELQRNHSQMDTYMYIVDQETEQTPEEMVILLI